MNRVAVLGATGSIGGSTLDVIARHPQRFRASVLTAHRQVEALVALCVQHRPDLAVIADPALEAELARRLAAAGVRCEVASGHAALTTAAASGLCDTVVAAIVGAAGLESTLAAAHAGKRLLLANKEAIVMAGPLLLEAVASGGGALIPVDSEHNAIFQCLPGGRPDLGRSGVRRAGAFTFEGFTWHERFMVISTTFDFQTIGYAKNAYIADPDQWVTLFQMPGEAAPYWRIVIPTDIDTPEDVLSAPDAVEAWLQNFEPRAEPYEVLYASFYRVHQRVARNFRSGRVVLAGDSAHLNNPLGAFGLNSGIQDAANLIPKLAAVWHGTGSESLLDLYDRQRHTATVEHVQANSIANKKTMELRDPDLRRAHFEELVRTANTPDLARRYLINSSMIAAVQRASEVV